MIRDLPLEIDAGSETPLGMDPASFLRDYWQRRPLLVRSAFPGFTAPLQGDDLAGLSCESETISRLVLCEPESNAYRVEHGPFAEQRFAALGDRNWTLLVEDVDKWDADVAALLESFRFLPDWRVDDVMVSYAAAGGGVGPHIDQYDVFLLQGQGEREWRIRTAADTQSALRDDCELAVLRDFEPEHAFRLQPGDMLYLPPGVAHDGIACEEGMTYSIGMRAPSRAELLLDLAEYAADQLGEDQRYRDHGLLPSAQSAEIDVVALARVREALGPASGLVDTADLGNWFGKFISRYRSSGIAATPEQPLEPAELSAALASGHRLWRHPHTRMAWARDGKRTTLFAGGEAYPVPGPLAQAITRAGWQEPVALPDGDHAASLLPLVNAGQLILEAP